MQTSFNFCQRLASKFFIVLATSVCFVSVAVQANSPKTVPKVVLADLSLLQSLGIEPLISSDISSVAIAQLTEREELNLSRRTHSMGRCGGYEVLDEIPTQESGKNLLYNLVRQQEKSFRLLAGEFLPTLTFDPRIEAAVADLSTANLQTTVSWMSNFPTRYNKLAQPNAHVEALKSRLEALLSGVALPWQITLVSHVKTPQKSLRLRFQGSQRPEEVVVLGAHFDSINSGGGFFPSPNARSPGADDNASGSANLLEAIRVFVMQGQPQRSVEFFWYAGEESGLLGSAEIAKEYKTQGIDVVGVLQLDMSLYAGQGRYVFSSMTDFTSEWLRSYLLQINDLYIKATITEDRCGYGCSDHASWFRQGYATLMPFEANMKSMNSRIHTERDVVDASSDFDHSGVFSKIALVFAMDLGNSLQRPNMNTELPMQKITPVSFDRRRCLTPLGLALDRICDQINPLF